MWLNFVRSIETTETIYCYHLTEIDFIKRVDKGRITTVKDLESWRLES